MGEALGVGPDLLEADAVVVEDHVGGALTQDLESLEGSAEAVEEEELEGVGQERPQVDVIADDFRESGFNGFS